MSGLFSIITTIQPPTDSVIELSRRLETSGGSLIVVGDRKGPVAYAMPGSERTRFLTLAEQLNSNFELARKLPTGHYCRKNIGYLEAIAAGAKCIYETDDDNAPLPAWAVREEMVQGTRDVVLPVGGSGWINVYRYFSGALIWPRGLPLDEIRSPVPEAIAPLSGAMRWSPIQQGLVDNAPDVDAIWRLALDRPFSFEQAPSVYLAPGAWCPFNTQSTWWWSAAFPLLYIPSHCTFRMCDIWKSFVAQRCLWELDAGVTFHAAEVVQRRNAHNLMRDFVDEIPGYEGNRRLVETLEHTDLQHGAKNVGANLRVCYQALVTAGFFPEKELALVEAWLAEVVTAAHVIRRDVSDAGARDVPS